MRSIGKGNHSVRVSILACLIGVFSLVQGSDELATFGNQKYRYTVQYPANWHPQILEDIFYIENFPPSKAVRAVRLPNGGAGIRILTSSQIARGHRETLSTLDDLVTLDMSGKKFAQKRILDLADGQETLSVVEVKTTCCGSDVFDQTAWYFQIDGRMFVARLFCWQGDPNAEKFRDTLKQIVLSLKVIPETRRE
jgi:hypothetical protein